ncbi:uncharacterized protein [Temnothorax longispinosus]|uniref:uncharacterized protein n=1 Tax=Temnothorax longispinosus TaxID=300112 RepID=UPI003A98D1C5
MSADEFDDDEFEDELELNDKELIMCVRANPFLYNKSDKRYSDNELKNLAWDQIGNSLTKKKTGAEAEHRFFQLRQRFGRERRKVIQSEPRSGAGASQPTYTPQWNLYKELMFLTDVIKHRKTTSNYRKKQSTSQKTQQVNLPTTNIILPLPGSSGSTSNSFSISNLWNQELSVAASGISDEAGENSSKSEPLLPLQSSQQSSLSNSSLASDNIKEMSPVEQMQKSLSRYEKRVPKSDYCTKRKKRDGDNFNQSMFEQYKTLNVLAEKVDNALSKRAPPSCIPDGTESSLRPDVKAMLTSIAFAVQQIPEFKQLDFLIAIIQLVKQYTEGDEKT